MNTLMNTHGIAQRIRGLLLTPKEEWEVIAAEPASIQGIYRDYVLILALVPAVCGFIRSVYLGWLAPGMQHYQTSPLRGLAIAAITYVTALLSVFIFGLVIDLLAPNFGGRRHPVQALKAAAYSYTGIAIAGLASLFVWLGVLIALAGLVYSVYLLSMGLAATMRSDPDRNAAYTTVSIVLGVVLFWVIASVVRAVIGFSLFGWAWGPY